MRIICSRTRRTAIAQSATIRTPLEVHFAHLNALISCAACHNSSAMTRTSLVSGTVTHANGVVDVIFAPGLNGNYNETTRICSALYCHSDGTSLATGNVPVGSIPGGRQALPALAVTAIPPPMPTARRRPIATADTITAATRAMRERPATAHLSQKNQSIRTVHTICHLGHRFLHVCLCRHRWDLQHHQLPSQRQCNVGSTPVVRRLS